MAVPMKFRALLLGLLAVLPATALSIPRPAVVAAVPEPRSIALKLSPSFSPKQKRSDPLFNGAELAASLVRKSLAASSKSKRDDAAQPHIRSSPLFDLPPEAIDEIVKRAQANDPTYQDPDFHAWFTVELPAETPDVELRSLVKTLRGYSEVAALQPVVRAPAAAPAVQPNDDPQFANQDYLKASPRGINAEYAWGFPGGDGAGQRVVDIETGWKLEHEDLAAKNIQLLSGDNSPGGSGNAVANLQHGTPVLGIMVMVDNAIGGVGVAPGADAAVVGVQRGSTQKNYPAAILDATSRMAAGEVMLLEIQVVNDAGNQYWPVELYPAEFDAIQAATASGIVVVEPAGNGVIVDGETGSAGVNLDSVVALPFPYEDEPAAAYLNPSSPDYRGDSGAIIVGASVSGLPHAKTVWSNYGARVDVHAWGENVVTSNCVAPSSGGGCNDTYLPFGGTSAAAPIVAGAALSVQGMLVAQGKPRLNSVQMRALLKVGGTPASDPQNGNIGVQPDLRALIDGGHI
ncbi:peptidase S8/S53 domain-containing protein [Podospora aff. communis PSN243]|uniref:Peptidase S8/S53 domain-containing protein n=1 Tax=Podospora aff. communis PSN243 TaxID=3040156 RepID=A0AAV9GMS7_9PEZI|nr:peptidase S8/S53 domain-containing protein [Podospora aff. communis PSN243]